MSKHDVTASDVPSEMKCICGCQDRISAPHSAVAHAEMMASVIEQYIAAYDRNEAHGRGAMTMALIPLFEAVRVYREAGR